MHVRNQLYIGGQWVSPATDDTIEIIAPATEQPFATVAAAAHADIDAAVVAARTAFDQGPWPRTDPAERVAVVRQLAQAYGERRKELAATVSAELGAPITFAKRAQIGLPPMVMGTLADIAEGYAWQETRPGVYGRPVVVRKEPVGVVAAIVPWNMPQFLIATKLVPALLAGCTIVIKPSPESALDALLLAEVLDQVGLPEGVVSIVPGGREAGAHLVAHPGVDKVSFTGSTAAGKQVAAAAAQNLTKVSLELGGKSAAIALDDADPAAVAQAVTLSGINMAFQTCNALTRVIVPAARADEYAEALAAQFTSQVLGDPADPATTVGPLVAQRQQARVTEYIESGLADGARLVTGGTGLPDGVERGWYVRPTVFTDVDNSMRIARDEIFGPVLVVIPAADEAEAVRLANDSDYGLAGSVFTADTERGFDIATRVRAGTFGINEGYMNDPAASFGGVKGSGYGRELGREGLESYLDTKSISGA